MDLYYENQKVSILQLLPGHTVGLVKQILHNWLVPQGITDYNIRIFFNDGSELTPVVLNSSQYDNVNFHAQSSILTGGKIYIIPMVPKPTSNVTLKNLKFSLPVGDFDATGGNKYFTVTKIPVNITLKAKISGISQDKSGKVLDVESIKEELIHRYSQRILSKIVEQNNLVLGHVFWTSTMKKNIYTIQITDVMSVSPKLVKCSNCSYKTFFAVCKNCEDKIKPNKELFSGFMKELSIQKRYLDQLKGKIFTPIKKEFFDEYEEYEEPYEAWGLFIEPL